MVSFIGLKTKVGGKNMEPTKKDWKLYRERIGDWQEAYMEKLVQKPYCLNRIIIKAKMMML